MLISNVFLHIGRFIQSPSDIVKTRGISKLFKKIVFKEALRVFFNRHQVLIEHTGFRFSTGLPYDNFRSLFVLAAKILNRRVSRLDQLLLGLDRLMKSPHIQFPRKALRAEWVDFKRRDLKATNCFWEWVRGVDERMKSIRQISYQHSSDLSFIPHEIVVLKSLENLTLSKSRLTYVPAFLAQLTELRFLVLSGNRIDSVFCNFSQMPKLHYLDLSLNYLEHLPDSELFDKNDCLCMKLDAQTLFNSKDVLDHYPTLFFTFSLPPLDDCFNVDFFNSVMLHNAQVFQKFSEGEIDLSKEIPIESVNDMLDWNQLGLYKKQFPMESLERRMINGVRYLSILMPSRRQ